MVEGQGHVVSKRAAYRHGCLYYPFTHAGGKRSVVRSDSDCDSVRRVWVRVRVCALKRKRHELSTPNLVHI